MITLIPIKPKVKIADADKILKAVRRATEQETGLIIADLQKTIASWSKPARFVARVGPTGAEVRTDNEIWNMLDAGTKPHLIIAKPGKLLRFPANYAAKTRAKSLSSGSGGASGPIRFARIVRHPGTFARRWTETAQAESARRYPPAVQAAISDAVR